MRLHKNFFLLIVVCVVILLTFLACGPGTCDHQYTSEIITESSCTTKGMKRYTCSACQDSYTEKFDHPCFTATEIYDAYLNSVGEIVVYNKSGESMSLGTCFVYSDDGKIITNYHVIEDGYSAEIKLSNRTYNVQKVLAYDKNIDLAVLKINATNLKPVTLCESSHKVGEIVYAFGNSQGLTSTFSDGMITFSSRDVDGVNYVQHDAPISSGNSGGPLINKYGEVIGVNTWTLRDSQNLNFAILVSEFQNLDYSTSMSMAQFYEKEGDAYNKLRNYIVSNGQKPLSKMYDIKIASYYSDDYTMNCTHDASYFPDSGSILLSFTAEDNDMMAMLAISIDNDIDGVYSWSYFDDRGYRMEGTLYAWNFTEGALLSYSYCNVSDLALKQSLRRLASMMAARICSGINVYLDDIGITAADLGFTSYE